VAGRGARRLPIADAQMPARIVDALMAPDRIRALDAPPTKRRTPGGLLLPTGVLLRELQITSTLEAA
jgi:hypothetical protein